MPIFGSLTWYEHIFFFTFWIFTDAPSYARDSTLQKYDKVRDKINALKNTKLLDFYPKPRFPRFNELPPEIRAQIWEASFERRTIELRADYGPRTTELGSDWSIEHVCAITQPPSQLHACRESRAEALKAYALSFGSGPSDSVVYFSPARDTVFFGSKWGFYAAQHCRILTRERARRDGGAALIGLHRQNRRVMVGWDKIQSVALRFGTYSFANAQLLASDLGLMPSLKDVTLVAQADATVFDLGREPRLVRRGEGDVKVEVDAETERKTHELRYWLRRLWIKRGMNLGDAPNVWVGTFVKGASDRWFVWERGRWPF